MDKSEEQFIKEELILRDYLATDRTILAVDRTFLAYVRTALTLFVAGVSFIKFFNSLFIQVLGWLLIPFGIITLVFGLKRCNEIISLIKKLTKKHIDNLDSAGKTLSQPLEPVFSITGVFKDIYSNFFRIFLPAAHHTEQKTRPNG